jgi:hypothetical protein
MGKREANNTFDAGRCLKLGFLFFNYLIPPIKERGNRPHPLTDA